MPNSTVAIKLERILREHGYGREGTRTQRILVKFFRDGEGIEEAEFHGVLKGLIKNINVFQKKENLYYSTIKVLPFMNKLFFVDSPDIASTSGGAKFYANRDGFYGYIGNDGLFLTRHVTSRMEGHRFGKVLDLCTGSGVVGISIAHVCDEVRGVDIDEKAVHWATINAEINGSTNYSAQVGDLYEPVRCQAPFDVVTANPPYGFFSSEAIEQYAIRPHEVGKHFGLEFVFRIIDGLADNLSQTGRMFICVASPVRKRRDLLREALVERYAGERLDFVLNYKHRVIRREFTNYYRSIGIERLVFCILEVTRSESFSLSTKYSPLYWVSRFPWPSGVWWLIRFLFRVYLRRRIA